MYVLHIYMHTYIYTYICILCMFHKYMYTHMTLLTWARKEAARVLDRVDTFLHDAATALWPTPCTCTRELPPS